MKRFWVLDRQQPWTFAVWNSASLFYPRPGTLSVGRKYAFKMFGKAVFLEHLALSLGLTPNFVHL